MKKIYMLVVLVALAWTALQLDAIRDEQATARLDAGMIGRAP